jgi:hypothetical protein
VPKADLSNAPIAFVAKFRLLSAPDSQELFRFELGRVGSLGSWPWDEKTMHSGQEFEVRQSPLMILNLGGKQLTIYVKASGDFLRIIIKLSCQYTLNLGPVLCGSRSIFVRLRLQLVKNFSSRSGSSPCSDLFLIVKKK